jgi:hypothetical protein
VERLDDRLLLRASLGHQTTLNLFTPGGLVPKNGARVSTPHGLPSEPSTAKIASSQRQDDGGNDDGTPLKPPPPDRPRFPSVPEVPELSSNPGAPVCLYLDFDGYFESQWGAYRNVRTPVFDLDGNPRSFNSAELAAITEIWQRVAEDFAPFNLNVTTVTPLSVANGVSLRVAIGGSWQDWYQSPVGGISYVNAFTNSIPNTAYVFSQSLGSVQAIADAVAHEAGHSFGLQHQSTYDTLGMKTAEYNPGTNSKAPIMGVSYTAARSTWWKGPSSVSATTIQDDMAVIASATNGFGYRRNDHGNSYLVATSLVQAGNRIMAAQGIIETTADVDYFSFTTTGGWASLKVQVAEIGANLDAVAELWRVSSTDLKGLGRVPSLEALTKPPLWSSFRVFLMVLSGPLSCPC